MWARHSHAATFVSAMVITFGCGRELPPPPSEETCEVFCESLACYMPDVSDESLGKCRARCVDKFEESAKQGSDCEAAFEDAMDCIAPLTCEPFKAWYEATADDPCPSARAGVEDACHALFLEPNVLPP